MAFQRQTDDVVRVRLPRGKELLGWVEEMLGALRFRVSCSDGKVRICRVPGSLKRKVWVRQGDLVLLEPWEIENEKGDILFRYREAQINVLRKKGLLK